MRTDAARSNVTVKSSKRRFRRGELDGDLCPDDNYIQLYVPYDYFAKACQMIKSVYSKENGYKGYHNYMAYWARNGKPTWICDFSEYGGYNGNMTKVKKTYAAVDWWDAYTTGQSPL